MSEKVEGAFVMRQSIDTGSTGNKTQNEDKQNKFARRITSLVCPTS
jgi:hypothetical protein